MYFFYNIYKIPLKLRLAKRARSFTRIHLFPLPSAANTPRAAARGALPEGRRRPPESAIPAGSRPILRLFLFLFLIFRLSGRFLSLSLVLLAVTSVSSVSQLLSPEQAGWIGHMGMACDA